jgi:hypothetical protein
MLEVLIPEQSFSSFGIEMVDLHIPTAPTIARKEAARTARKAYWKRKTRQVAAMRAVRASKAEKNDPQGELQGEPPGKKGEPQVEPLAYSSFGGKLALLARRGATGISA